MSDALRTVHAEPVMGTVVTIDLRGGSGHPAAIAEVVAWLHEVDRRFSPYRDDSEVSRYGRGEIDAGRSPDLEHVVEVCDRVERASGGAFTARRDAGYDPNAYVKGWAADRAAELLRRRGITDFFLNAGGDVRTSGSPAPGRSWTVGIQHPFDPGAVAMVVTGHDLALATSGTSERGRHLIDGRTGLPADDRIAQVSVLGPDLGLADAFSTAAFALGEDGPAWIAGIDGYESYTVFADARVIATAGFPAVVHGVPVSTEPHRPAG